MNADERVYGRYGGRDAASADKRLSLTGMRYAMTAALEAHAKTPNGPPPQRAARPQRAEDYPAAKRIRAGQCVHCHQVYEFRREALQESGKWDRDMVWVYPPPENVGFTLEVARGDRVAAVAGGSAADKAGLRVGDRLRTLNGFAVASFADAQYALHRAPARGHIPFTAERDGRPWDGRLELAPGWRETNITWRASLLDVLPSLSLIGDDLSAAEKKALGLPEKRLAFRQDKNVHPDAAAAGVRANDIIVGVDDKVLEMPMLKFLGHVRRNYRVGETITLNVIRDGKPLKLPLKLR